MAQLTTDASSGIIQAFVTGQSIRAHRIDNQRLTENDWQQVFAFFRTITPPSEPMPIPVHLSRSKPVTDATEDWAAGELAPACIIEEIQAADGTLRAVRICSFFMET